MTGKYRTLMGVLAACLMTSTTLFAAQQAKEASRPISPVAKSATNVTAVDHGSITATAQDDPGLSLGRAVTESTSPGKLIGDTWYDLQANGSMGRMVDWGWDDSNQVLVHFSWSRIPVYPGSDRSAAYNCYYSVTDSMLGQTMVQDPAAYGGFPNLDAAVDNRAVIAAHTGGGSCVYWDFAPGFGFFGKVSCIDDTVRAYATGQDVNDSLKSVIWPKFRYHDIAGQEPVTHMAAEVSEPGAGDAQAVIYFRKVGVEELGTWDYPPYIFDTAFNIGHDVACSNIDGKMALVWIANRPDPGDCDTCSSQTGWPFTQWDNDIYFQVSDDYGATFEPRVNMTMNVDGVDGYRPYADLSALIGSDNNLRIGWGGRFWPADANQGGQAGLLRCRMFYWGENLGTGGFDQNGDAIIRTAARLDWDQTICNGGAWQLNGSKMTLSECDGKLYYIWVQFNDVANGIEDDCAERAFGEGGDAFGSANGELYFTVSNDGGLLWDLPRNLTNTYTPHCDTEGGPGGRCQSEHFPSMSRFGTNHALPGSDYVIVDPSSGYTGDYFLDVQYIDDPSPGVILQDEGTWMLNDVRWFRLPCVEPEFFACIGSSGSFVATTGHGEESWQWISFYNDCNQDANYTLTVTDHTGPPGWLVHGFPETGVIPAGSIGDATFILNAGGIVNEPGTWVTLRATMLFEGPFENSPLTIEVVCHVVPETYEQWPDTLETSCLSLVVRGNGNYGNQGAGKVNMDFFNHGDCDDLEWPDDTIPGYSTVYLYDASPVICWPDGDSVLCNWSIFGSSPWLSNGFLPVSYEAPVDSGDYWYYESEFHTQDSGVGVQQSWYAPKDQPDTCQFLIHRMRIFSNDDQTHTDLAIGEVIDWDIPSDSANRNTSGFDTGLRLIYQVGSEYNEDPEECMDNNDRFGGISLVQMMVGVDAPITDPYGAYTIDNATQVYPSGGLDVDSVWSKMGSNEGYVMADSFNADLHSMMTYRFGYTLQPDDTLDIVSVLATSMGGYADFIAAVQAGHQWSQDHILPHYSCCIGKTGNIDDDPSGSLDISDLVYLVDFMFTGGPEPPCFLEADVNCDGAIDISDLVYIVDCMFNGWPCEFCDCPPPEDP